MTHAIITWEEKDNDYVLEHLVEHWRGQWVYNLNKGLRQIYIRHVMGDRLLEGRTPGDISGIVFKETTEVPLIENPDARERGIYEDGTRITYLKISVTADIKEFKEELLIAITCQHNRQCTPLIRMLERRFISESKNILTEPELLTKINEIDWRNRQDVSLSFFSEQVNKNKKVVIFPGEYVSASIAINNYSSGYATGLDSICSEDKRQDDVHNINQNKITGTLVHKDIILMLTQEYLPPDLDLETIILFLHKEEEGEYKEKYAVHLEYMEQINLDNFLSTLVEHTKRKETKLKKDIVAYQEEYQTVIREATKWYTRIQEKSTTLKVLKLLPTLSKETFLEKVEEIKKINKVTGIVFGENKIKVSTSELYCTNDVGTKIKIGKVEIQIFIGDDLPEARNLSDPTLRAGCHFGYDSRTSACWGMAQEGIIQLQAELDFCNLVAFIINFIEAPPGDSYGADGFQEFVDNGCEVPNETTE